MSTPTLVDSSAIKAYKDYYSSSSFLKSALTIREGHRPKCGDSLPHFQLEDQSPDEVFQLLTSRAAELLGDGVTVGHSTASLPSTYPCYFLGGKCAMPYEASMTPGGPRKGREFAHIHTKYFPEGNSKNQGGGQGSMHLCLSLKDAATVLESRWGERHLMAGEVFNKKWAPGLTLPRGLVMVYAPRTKKEVDIVLSILEASYAFANSEREED